MRNKLIFYMMSGHSASLVCKYDLQNSSLYSVKWYKNGQEFFRFMPSMSPATEVFAVPGVIIDVSTNIACLLAVCITLL